MSSPGSIHSQLHACLKQAKDTHHRRLVVLSGQRDWAEAIVEAFLQAHPFPRSTAITDSPIAGCEPITATQTKQVLGQDIHCLVFDAWSGLNPDALASSSGALVGGGLLILLTPALDQWPEYDDPDYQRLLVYPYQSGQIGGRFLRFFQSQLLADEHALLIEQKDFPQPLLKSPELKTFEAHESTLTRRDSALLEGDKACLTADQAAAVAAILKVKTGHSKRPLVITADRGRGKSSALGIASARLLQQGNVHIVVTAPRPDSVAAVFQRATELLGIEYSGQTKLVFDQRHSGNRGSLRFVPPDELLRTDTQADLLLVDEAAAIPVAMLKALLHRFNRIVFASTIHGYEGTGRGFEIRFKRELDQHRPQWKALTLSEPVRWAANDPVERWLFKSLLLDAKAVDDQSLNGCKAEQLITERLSRDRLLEQPADLKAVFGLLITAHYQTTPADLRNLLDGPNIQIWVVRYKGNIVAAAILSEEGGFDAAMAEAIWRGERRPRGHLLPQSLCAHAGIPDAPILRYLRVMRIAVHSAIQRQHIGQRLVSAIVKAAREQGIDLFGSSFAATEDVVRFWHSCGCMPVRIGVSKDAATGCHSLVVLSALSKPAGTMLNTLRQRFVQQLPLLLTGIFSELEAELVLELLRNNDNSLALDQQDWLDIRAFCAGYRQYQQCFVALWKCCLVALSQPELEVDMDANKQALRLPIKLLLQQQPVHTVVQSLQLTGKKQLQIELRGIINKLAEMLLRIEP